MICVYSFLCRSQKSEQIFVLLVLRSSPLKFEGARFSHHEPLVDDHCYKYFDRIGHGYQFQQQQQTYLKQNQRQLYNHLFLLLQLKNDALRTISKIVPSAHPYGYGPRVMWIEDEVENIASIGYPWSDEWLFALLFHHRKSMPILVGLKIDSGAKFFFQRGFFSLTSVQ